MTGAMRVLLLGGTGNLGSRVIPALLAHNHEVIAQVRSPEKLRKVLPPDMIERITIIQSSAWNSIGIAGNLRKYSCDAVINTAGTRKPPSGELTLGQIVSAITSAAIEVGETRGQPLRAWIIGGMGSLQYPGTNNQIQDFMPDKLTEHHRATGALMKSISVDKLAWSLLCVAMMNAKSEEINMLSKPTGHQLLLRANLPPGPEEPWRRALPTNGAYLDLGLVFREYGATYEDIADLLAEEIGKTNFVGDFIGYRSSLK